MTRHPLLVLALGSAASAVAQSPAEQMAELVAAWVGHPVEALIETWGEGTASVSETSGHPVYTYVAESRGSTIHSAGFGVNTGSGACAVRFEVQGGVIVAATWTTEGTRDRDKSRRACWREFRRNTAPTARR